MNRPILAVINEDYPKVKSSDANSLSDLINFIITILNIKVENDPDEIKKMNQQMLLVGDMIRTKFGYLTIPEIKEAFKMYVSKEFSNIKVFRILDCISIGEVLTAFTDFRNESLRVYDKKKEKLLIEQNKISEEEKQQIRNYFLLVIYNDLLKNGYSDDAWQLFFDLEKSGKINSTTEDKKALYNEELKKYIPAHKEEIRLKGPFAAKSLLKDFQSMIDSGKNITAVQNKCRSILVSKYLKDYLADFETFKNAIENE